MITSPAFRGKRYAVLGLARSGAATVRSLLASGAEVTAWDTRPEPRAPFQGSVTLADPLEIDLAGYDGIVVSPGVPLNRHPIADKARAAGVPIIGDIELFAQARPDLPPHRVVGITGTNGKSTTTALIHHILVTAGLPATLGGNIGLPILGQEPLPEGGVYVLELSSYQIDLTQSLDCDVALLLNITPDHLDRYDGFDGYVASKQRLFEMQSADHFALFAAQDAPSEAIAKQLLDRRAATNVGPRFAEAFADEVDDQDDYPTLQGPHNAQNIAAASMTAMLLGIDQDAIEAALRSYPGLPHRMERIAERNGVLYVNDSKATNATSTAPALAAFPPVEGGRPRIRWILGGRAKTEELDACAPFFGNVHSAYTIGEAGPMFARLLRPHMPVCECKTLDKALAGAAAAALPGEVVLLSPACASFDQFADFEARGDAFRAAVEGL
ncbi:MAG: UDP-N-acetylmuramoylalanine--D-glutamate ligase [Sphingomonas bacterium]|nr:UDP-N-acetylmuramoylalanine--D-glutamate ligase [Sphingomonas bacterium]